MNLLLIRLIDERFSETPWYGSRRVRHLRHLGYCAGRERVRQIMRLMGLLPIFQKPHTGKPHREHRVYPYLLRGFSIERATKVWCAEVTYI